MNRALSFCLFAVCGVFGANRVVFAQCFLCSDANSNTAVGTDAFLSNSSGSSNNASGYGALQANTSGSRNNAAGAFALANSNGNDNNGVGYVALYANTSGTLNNAVGNFSLFANTTGSNNSAVGYGALYKNTTGSNNNAQGFYALQNNTTGSNNIAVGQYAGTSLTTGSSNIDIGNYGVAGESGVIRIGSSATQVAAYMAGVSTSTITGAAVYVSSSGRLGVLASSERYKTSVAPMGARTDNLLQLRPVTFHLKSEPQGPLQYGLIAEQVAQIYPELVIRDDAGKIQGVRYDALAPMLLNEVQQQKAQLSEQGAEIRDMRKQVAELRRINESMQAALSRLQTNRVAMR
jgi:hypothetical protein